MKNWNLDLKNTSFINAGKFKDTHHTDLILVSNLGQFVHDQHMLWRILHSFHISGQFLGQAHKRRIDRIRSASRSLRNRNNFEMDLIFKKEEI